MPWPATAGSVTEGLGGRPERVPGGLGRGQERPLSTGVQAHSIHICLGDERKSYQGRSSEYARPNKMMDEVER